MDRNNGSKSKTVAVVLAIFLSYWSWLYTSKHDKWKFITVLVTHIIATVIGLGLFALAAWVLWALASIVALINQASRDKDFFDNYQNQEVEPASGKTTAIRLLISFTVFAVFIIWQVNITSSVVEDDGDQITTAVGENGLEFRLDNFECGVEVVAQETEDQAHPPEELVREPLFGQFCQLDFTVTNTGSGIALIDSANQVAVQRAADGATLEWSAREYKTDQAVPNQAGHCYNDELQAGETKQCLAIFDVQAEADIHQIRFKSGPTTDGVLEDLLL